MKYDCNNNPHRTTGGSYPVQDGWTYNDHGGGGTATREPVIVMQADRMTSPCMYDKSSTDSWCAGCERQKRQPGAIVLPNGALPVLKADAIRLRAMGREGVTTMFTVEFLVMNQVVFAQHDIATPTDTAKIISISGLGPNCGELMIEATMDLNGFHVELPQIKRKIGIVFLSPGESIYINMLDIEIKAQQ